MSQRFSVLALCCLMVLASAVAVVYTRHQSRELFSELRGFEKKIDELNVDWSQLQLEYGTWSMDARVDDIARRDLRMFAPDFHDVRIINR